MALDDLIKTKQEQLQKLEDAVEEKVTAAGGKVSSQIASFRAKRDELVARLDALKTNATERVDVLRMGVESAWTELQTAFEMATRPSEEQKG